MAIAFGPYLVGNLAYFLAVDPDEGASILGGLILGVLLIAGIVASIIYLLVRKRI